MAQNTLNDWQSHAIGHESNQPHLLRELEWVGGQWSVQRGERGGVGGGPTRQPRAIILNHQNLSEEFNSQGTVQHDIFI